MISAVKPSEFNSMLHVINDAAQAYKGVIPADVWKEPYMSAEELKAEIDSGVQFYRYRERGVLVAVMGIQQVKDVTLIRHAYTLTTHQRRGLGEKLLQHDNDEVHGGVVVIQQHDLEHRRRLDLGLFRLHNRAVAMLYRHLPHHHPTAYCDFLF